MKSSISLYKTCAIYFRVNENRDKSALSCKFCKIADGVIVNREELGNALEEIMYVRKMKG